MEIREFLPDQKIDWLDLFNEQKYYSIHKNSTSHYFVGLYNNNVEAVCHVAEIQSHHYHSPKRGTYAGPQFKPGTTLEQKTSFLINIEEEIKKLKAEKISFTLPPVDYYTTETNDLIRVLKNIGYSIETSEEHYILKVDEVEMGKKMMRNNQKRLRKCLREGFQFVDVNGDTEQQNVYQIISENRKNKGYSLSLSAEQIHEMKNIFPQQIHFFKCTLNNIDVAASICLRVNKNVLYAFYWGDLPGFEQYSSISFLSNGIYNFCRQNNITILDAGTSSINNLPNEGLILFKKNLGFEPSAKHTYSKILS